MTVIFLTIAIVALFVLGMSLTLIFKGHNIKSEIGENEHMKERGIKCVIQEAREQEGLERDGCGEVTGCSLGSCSTCQTPEAPVRTKPAKKAKAPRTKGDA